MISSKPKIFAALSLILAMLACSLPSVATPSTVNEQAATAVAATLSAVPASGSTSQVTATHAAVPTNTASSPTTGAGTPTITPTYSTPMLTVLQQTNCREGPGQDYKVLFTYLAKVKLEIVGRYDPTNFWLVKSPESKTGTCWLWGEYTEASGSYWVVPTVTPPPTVTLPPPAAPSVKWDFSCSGGNMTFNMQWEDRATNEDGYRVFRDGEAVAELPANSTSWTETIPLESGKSVSYYLQVYGPSGAVNASLIKISC
ncbi:MAG: hypothetical protein ACM3XO_11775 [Bacteroidota bacterium]